MIWRQIGSSPLQPVIPNWKARSRIGSAKMVACGSVESRISLTTSSRAMAVDGEAAATVVVVEAAVAVVAVVAATREHRQAWLRSELRDQVEA